MTMRGLAVETVPGAALTSVPRLSAGLDSVLVGPYTSSAEHERHFLDTVGSGNWYHSEFDEFRFDKASGDLVSFWLNIPERNGDLESHVARWRRLPEQTGLLRSDGTAHFDLLPAENRWCSPEGDVLAGMYSNGEADSSAELSRVRVAPDFDLLLAGGVLRGWLLSSPARYISEIWDSPVVTVHDPHLDAILRDYLLTVEHGNIELMEDGDPGVREALRELLARLDAEGGDARRRRLLRGRVVELIEDFYE